MRKDTKIMNCDELLATVVGKLLHITLGRLVRELRHISPLTHEEMAEQSSINSGTAWRLENKENASARSFGQAFYLHFKALGCCFNLFNLCRHIEKALASGQCIVILQVPPSEIGRYEPGTVLFYQDPPNEEEMSRRSRQKQSILRSSRKKRRGRKKTGKKD